MENTFDDLACTRLAEGLEAMDMFNDIASADNDLQQSVMVLENLTQLRNIITKHGLDEAVVSFISGSMETFCQEFNIPQQELVGRSFAGQMDIVQEAFLQDAWAGVKSAWVFLKNLMIKIWNFIKTIFTGTREEKADVADAAYVAARNTPQKGPFKVTTYDPALINAQLQCLSEVCHGILFPWLNDTSIRGKTEDSIVDEIKEALSKHTTAGITQTVTLAGPEVVAATLAAIGPTKEAFDVNDEAKKAQVDIMSRWIRDTRRSLVEVQMALATHIAELERNQPGPGVISRMSLIIKRYKLGLNYVLSIAKILNDRWDNYVEIENRITAGLKANAAE